MVRSSNYTDKSLRYRLREKQRTRKGAKRISADRLLRLSKLFGVRPVYFFGFGEEDRPVQRNEARLTLPDQGLRLHRAFVGVKNPTLREAIVSLVTELSRNDDPA